MWLIVRFALRLQHRFSHFLDEERNAICALQNVCLMLAGSGLLPGTWSMMAAISRCPAEVSADTSDRPSHGGSNSGRKVIISSTPTLLFDPRSD